MSEEEILKKYTKVFIEIMQRGIPPWRLRQAIIMREDISGILNQRQGEIRGESQHIRIPGIKYWRYLILTKPAIKKYISDVMKDNLPAHYMIACRTPGGLNYVADQVGKVIDMVLDD